jgi:hypothetical protein
MKLKFSYIKSISDASSTPFLSFLAARIRTICRGEFRVHVFKTYYVKLTLLN